MLNPPPTRSVGGVGAATTVAMGLLALCATSRPAFADIDPHGGMLRYPDVSSSHIVFVYANDLWLAPREGGTATPLASPPGMEAYPRFSPEGETIAFVGNYDGNKDLYTVPTAGGLPTRVTHHPGVEILSDWTPGGELIFFTNSFAGRNRQTQLFTVGASGGLPEQMPVPYGANGAVSADGQWLAYTPHSVDTRTWKRYRGGMATDIWLFNLNDFTSKQITDWEGVDTLPMWNGRTVYYLSDEGADHRVNIWSYDTASGRRAQVTRFKDFDVKWPAMGPGPNGGGEIVFQCGADLYLLDLATNMMRPVEIAIPGARATLRERTVDAKELISSWDLSPTGARAAVEARGDIWTLPAKLGSPRNLTRTSGVAERSPAWSPDGRWIAYFADETGEYELYITQSDGKGETKQLTKGSSAYYYAPSWSPDSKHITYTDKTGAIFLCTLESGETKQLDKDPWTHGQTTISWSHDSRWIAYDRNAEETQSGAVYLYNVASGEKHKVTDEMFNSGDPVFDRKGDYLYFSSNRSFAPMYGELDTSFIYAATGTLLAVPLRADMKSPWAPKSDEEKWDDEKKSDKDDADKDEGNDEDGDDEKKDDGKKADDGVSGTWEGTITGGAPLPPGGLPFTMTLNLAAEGELSGAFSVAIGSGSFDSGSYNAATKELSFTLSFPDGPTVQFKATISGEEISGTAIDAAMGVNAEFTGKRTAKAEAGDDDKKDGKADSKPAKEVVIDIDGFERRAMPLPVKPGNFGRLSVNDKNQLLYVRGGFRGSDETPSIKLFDITDDKKEEKNVASGARAFTLSADGKKMLVMTGGSATIQDASSGATGSPVVTAGMMAQVDPREEWKQVFTEAWRVQRDYFYDPNMHGVDWPALRDQYATMLDDCATREDVGYVISELISELNVGHAYYRGGGPNEDKELNVAVGLLGCDYELHDGAFRISKIHEGAAWDSDARGPLSQPGVDVKEGDYLLAVNGVPVDTEKDPWAPFQGLVGRAVTITVSDKPTMDDAARDVVVECIADETNLRYRAWIEQNRAHVEYRTGGRAGYIYVPSTGIDGQNDLIRQFYGQRHKPALIIDERWNSGGQIPTRFIELLNRPITNYWARRDGADWAWPPDTHQGPKVMLMNGLSGSGGDAFPAYFRQAGLGKLIGTRTWGGLVGISGNPGMIDGTGVTVPTFGYYKKDGTWGIEGHGVDPDIEVLDDPALMRGGADPQLDAAIEHILGELQARPYTPPSRPSYPDRSGMGIPDSDR